MLFPVCVWIHTKMKTVLWNYTIRLNKSAQFSTVLNFKKKDVISPITLVASCYKEDVTALPPKKSHFSARVFFEVFSFS